MASAALILSACGGDLQFDNAAVAIVNGTQTSSFPAVGPLISDTSGCAATLIGEKHLLTAAHCVEEKWPVNYFEGTLTGTKFIGKNVIIHPDYAGGNRADLAVIELAEAVTGVEPIAIATEPPTVGEDVEIVGFGRENENGQFGTKRMTTNNINNVDEQTFAIKGGDGAKGNVCDGDSGGPTFANRDGQRILIGIHSTKKGFCGQIGNDMRVDVFAQWIYNAASGDATMVHSATQVAQYDGEGPGASDTCSSNAQCGAGQICQAGGCVDSNGNSGLENPTVNAGGCQTAAGGDAALVFFLALLVTLRRRFESSPRNRV